MDHHPLSGADMLLVEASDRLKGSEAARLAGEQKLAAYRQQMDAVLNGFAMIFPNEGWTTEQHPELGDMAEEFADHVVSRVKRLDARLKLVEEAQRETQRAAGVAIAAQTIRAASARGFIEPDVMAKAWFESYCDYWKAKGQPNHVQDWDRLDSQGQAELLAIAERVRAKFEAQDDSLQADVDAVAADLLMEGDTVAKLLERLNHVTGLLRLVWNDAIIPAIRGLHKLGIDVLPPGTIVHGAEPSTHPHRPE